MAILTINKHHTYSLYYHRDHHPAPLQSATAASAICRLPYLLPAACWITADEKEKERELSIKNEKILDDNSRLFITDRRTKGYGSGGMAAGASVDTDDLHAPPSRFVLSLLYQWKRWCW
jgi:hypothetical protein